MKGKSGTQHTAKATVKPVKPSKSKKTQLKIDPDERRHRIAILAYQRWEQATGGTVVDDGLTKQFWLDAEKEVDGSTDSAN